MNILIVSQYFWPESFKINNLCEHLSKKHNVTVLTSYPNYPKGEIFPEFKKNQSKFENYYNSKIIRVFQFQRKNGKPINLFLNYFSFLFFAFFKSFFLKKKFDLVLTFATSPIFVGLISILISKLNRAQSIIWVLDIWPEILKELNIIRSNFVIKIISIISTFIYQKHDIILTQSKSFKKIIEKKLKYRNKNNIVFFPSWPDELILNTKKTKKILKKKTINFLYTGNIGKAQDFENLVKAVESTKNSVNQKWYIVGDGRYKKKIIKMINEYNLKKYFNFYSFRSKKKLKKFFNLADFCFLALNKGKYLNSTIPAKLQTYMNCGLPILASIDGEAKNLILDAKCGFVARPGDFEDLALKIKKISNLKFKTLQRLGKNGKDFSKKNFDKKKLLNKLDKLISNKN